MNKDDFLGSWMLRRCYEEHDGKTVDEYALGEGANGCIHYLADGRMAVLIQYGGGPRLSAPYFQASDTELAAVARKFYAYAGPFSIEGDKVIHHLDTCSNPNDIGADYVRTVRFHSDYLTLGTPPEMRDGTIVELKLEWQAVSR